MTAKRNPFAGGGAADAACPKCYRSFWGWNAALRSVLHYLQDCKGTLSDRDIRDRVEVVLGRVELRLNQRDLLSYAQRSGFFAVTTAPDSISLHSLRRAGFMTICSQPGAPMRERFWHITQLGVLLMAAIDKREHEITTRKRTARRSRSKRWGYPAAAPN